MNELLAPRKFGCYRARGYERAGARQEQRMLDPTAATAAQSKWNYVTNFLPIFIAQMVLHFNLISIFLKLSAFVFIFHPVSPATRRFPFSIRHFPLSLWISGFTLFDLIALCVTFYASDLFDNRATYPITKRFCYISTLLRVVLKNPRSDKFV